MRPPAPPISYLREAYMDSLTSSDFAVQEISMYAACVLTCWANRTEIKMPKASFRLHGTAVVVTLRVIPTRPVVFPFLSSSLVSCSLLRLHPTSTILLVTMRLSLFGAWRFPAYDKT